MNKSKKILFLCLALILAIVVSDQYTKNWILANFVPGQIQSVIPNFFNLTLTFNPGVAFGMFANLDPNTRVIVLSTVSILAVGLIIYLISVQFKNDLIARLALCMILGGAIGNIIDRFRFGAVVDFLDVYYQSYHWPAFNIADSAICIAVFILLFRKPVS